MTVTSGLAVAAVVARNEAQQQRVEADGLVEFMLTDVVVLALVIYALLGKLADVLAKTLESLTLQWHPTFQKPAKG